MDYIKLEHNLENSMQDPALRHLLRERREVLKSNKYKKNQMIHIDDFLALKAPSIEPCISLVKPIGDDDYLYESSSVVYHACGLMNLKGRKYSDVNDVEPAFFDLIKETAFQSLRDNSVLGIQNFSYRANYVKVWEKLVLPFNTDDGPVVAIIAKPIILANQVLDTALNAVADGVVTVLPLIHESSKGDKIQDFVIISANTKFCTMFNFMPGSLKGVQLSKALPNIRDTPVWDVTMKAIQSKEPEKLETPILHKDKKIHVKMTASPISGGLTITLADQSMVVQASEVERQKTAELEKYAQNLESTQIAYREELMRRRELEQRLRYLAETDVMTGLFNRRKFLDKTENEVSRSKRYSRSLSVVMLDIDFFKSVNDKYGHAAGDAVIEMVGQICSDSIRENIDFAGRLGGEEFAVLLPESTLDAAVTFAERLRGAIENILVEIDGHHIGVTVSLGVAALQHDETASSLIRRADDALYASKSAGRNQVQIAA